MPPSSDSSAASAALLKEENPFMGLSSDSSVGRAGDCSKYMLNTQSSPGHWFDSGSEEFL